MLHPVGLRFTKLAFEPLQRGDMNNGVHWEEDGLYRIDKFFCSEYELSDGSVLRTEIHEGFVCNLRSGLALIDIVIPKAGPYSPIWVTHDGMYENPQVRRDLADRCMAFGLECCGMGDMRSGMAYRGVRIGGRGAYKKDTLQARRGLVSVVRLSGEQAAMTSPRMVGLPWDEEFME